MHMFGLYLYVGERTNWGLSSGGYRCVIGVKLSNVIIVTSKNTLLPTVKILTAYSTRGSQDHKLFIVTARKLTRINTLAVRVPNTGIYSRQCKDLPHQSPC